MIPICYKIKKLRLPLRTTFKQASSTRKTGESIWCEVSRGGLIGYGEGCPRKYVTNETMEEGIVWIQQQIVDVKSTCWSLTTLKNWVANNRVIIDKHPAAFCALETALLDLFAKEQGQSVEDLLGLKNPQQEYSYTAVLGDGQIERFKALLQRYLSIGFTDFKVKLSGDFSADQQKLDTIEALCHNNNCTDFRIRLDANNLWWEKTEVAINYLKKLKAPIFGIEEPIEPKNFMDLASISQQTGLPIILDESLCNLTDLANLSTQKGQFIANLKISKIGGLLRTLELIQQLQQKQILIIIGAHVGETSVLTRAGMTAANAVGNQLVAQEGGFGLLLLEKDQVQPSLNFGAKGTIDLRQPYLLKINQKPTIIPVENWNYGWGLIASL